MTCLKLCPNRSVQLNRALSHHRSAGESPGFLGEVALLLFAFGRCVLMPPQRKESPSLHLNFFFFFPPLGLVPVDAQHFWKQQRRDWHCSCSSSSGFGDRFWRIAIAAPI